MEKAMTKTTQTKTKPKKKACPIMKLIDKNELFMISNDNWNSQESRTFIMNADFRQMDSAKTIE